MQLQGFVACTNAPPTIQWKLYSGPATVNFGNPGQTNTTATFSAPGFYTLMLSAADGIHAVAYSAVNLTVTQVINLAINALGTNVSLTWTGGSTPFILEKSAMLPAAAWIPVLTNGAFSSLLPATGSPSFFRVRSN